MTPRTHPDGFISGGPIEGFTAGWAVATVSRTFHERAHLWEIQRYPYYRARCGVCVLQIESLPMLAPGSFPHCLRCERSAKLWPVTELQR